MIILLEQMMESHIGINFWLLHPQRDIFYPKIFCQIIIASSSDIIAYVPDSM